MKKIKILSVVILFFLIIQTKVYAIPKVNINENNEYKQNGIKEINISVKNDVEIGVLEGVLSYNSNIEIVDVCSSSQDWLMTYNNKNGKFNVVNPKGTKDGICAKIKYKLKNSKEKGRIVISNAYITTITYDTIKVDDIIKEIDIKAQDINLGEDNKEEGKKPEIDNNQEDNNPNHETEGNQEEDKKNETENNNKKPSNNNENEEKPNNNINETENTTDKKIPQLGHSKYIILILTLSFFIAIILGKRNKKLKL